MEDESVTTREIPAQPERLGFLAPALAAIESEPRAFGKTFKAQEQWLTAITGYSDLLLESLDRSDAAHMKVAQIKIAGTHAAALARQLLDLSRNART